MGRWIVGMLVLWVAGCAHRIAPMDAGYVAPTEPNGGMELCWLEFARSGPFTGSGLLARSPAGVVLIDAGQSLHFVDDIDEIAQGRFFLRLVPGSLVPLLPASEGLAAAEVAATEIDVFVATHVHSDHIGGLMDLPDLPVRLHPAELALLTSVAQGGTSWNVLPSHARRIVPTASPLVFVDRPFLTFRQRADLLGNGAVVAVPIPGHTPGSIGVLIDTGAVQVIHVGDAINTRSQLEELRGKSSILKKTDLDPAAADGQVAALSALHAAQPSLVILPAHERIAWLELFGAPGACIGSR